MSAPTVALANVDSAWLRMDDPTNLMVVTGVLMLDQPVPPDRMREILKGRLLQFPRFRQRVTDGGSAVGGQVWQEDGTFDIGYHLPIVDLPEPRDHRALERLVSSLMSQPLDASRPLWQFHFVPHYDGGSAIICRIHHCIGDGLALIYVMLSLSDDGPTFTPPAAAGDDDASPWDAVASALLTTVSAGLTLPVALFRQLSSLVFDPARMTEITGSVASGVGAVGKLLLMDPDPATALKGSLVVEKRVLVSAVTGGLRRYLLQRGADLPNDVSVRAVVPVNLRPLAEAHLLGNQFGLVFLELPLGVPEPLDRLFEVRRRMTAIKRSPEAYLTFQILRAIGTAPRQIFDLVVDLFQRKATAVMTNVIGPREPIRLAGVTMRQAMFWVPCAGRLGLGISVLSYAGDVWLGVGTDAHVIPDPHAVLDGFDAELESLRQLLTSLREEATS
jgi:hypothetical protein